MTSLFQYEIRAIPAAPAGRQPWSRQTMAYEPGVTATAPPYRDANGDLIVGLDPLISVHADKLGPGHNVSRAARNFVYMRFGAYHGPACALELELPAYRIVSIYDHLASFHWVNLGCPKYCARIGKQIDRRLAQYQRGDEPADLQIKATRRTPVCSGYKESRGLLMLLRELYGAGLPPPAPEPRGPVPLQYPGSKPPAARGSATDLLRRRFLR